MSKKIAKIALLPGDGIGKEVVAATKKVLDKFIKLDYVELEMGFEYFVKSGNKTALPQATLDEIVKCDGAIFGAVSSPSHKVANYSSPIVAMRKKLDLYANLRPCVSAPVKGSRKDVDMLIVRENTECLYVKDESISDTPTGRVAIAKRVISERACRRIAEMAYQQAMTRIKKKVTIVHKSNVLSVTDGLFREICLEVGKRFPDVKTEEQLVDSMVYKMIIDPTQYDVVVAPNLYGDILSDAAAALVGGLGLLGSGNVGPSFCLAEPVHGSAPDIEGKGVANPIGTIRSAAFLLKQLGKEYLSLSEALEGGIQMTLKHEKLTPDLGGNATTAEITKSIIEHTAAMHQFKQ